MKHPAIDADDSHVAVHPTGAVEQHAVDIGCRPGEDEGDRRAFCQIPQVPKRAGAGGAAHDLAVPDDGHMDDLG